MGNTDSTVLSPQEEDAENRLVDKGIHYLLVAVVIECSQSSLRCLLPLDMNAWMRVLFPFSVSIVVRDIERRLNDNCGSDQTSDGPDCARRHGHGEVIFGESDLRESADRGKRVCLLSILFASSLFL